MLKRKICVITGTRADYGLLYWIMKDVLDDPELKLQVVATGMHLSPEFGHTINSITGDGFNVDAEVEMLLSSDSVVGVTKSLGLGVIGFADVLERLKPDLIVVLGDRFEILAAVQAALIARIPVAHLHGGETTEGAFDEGIRHSITKMAHLHFVSAEPYRKRVIQLGESPDRVFMVGAPGLDYIKRKKLLDREAFEKSIDLDLGELSFLVTLHPETLSGQSTEKAAIALLDGLAEFHNARIIFTKSNADTHGRIINELLESYVDRAPERMKIFTSMGQLRYLSALKHVDVVIGNSSSGIIEAPALGVPTVNIGVRQKGRLMASSIIQCNSDKNAIAASIRKAVTKEIKAIAAQKPSLYGSGQASRQIVSILKRFKPGASLLMKSFHDL